MTKQEYQDCGHVLFIRFAPFGCELRPFLGLKSVSKEDLNRNMICQWKPILIFIFCSCKDIYFIPLSLKTDFSDSQGKHCVTCQLELSGKTRSISYRLKPDCLLCLSEVYDTFLSLVFRLAHFEAFVNQTNLPIKSSKSSGHRCERQLKYMTH